MTKNLSQKISLFSFGLSLMVVLYHTAGVVRDDVVRPINSVDHYIYFAGRSIFSSMLGAVPLSIYFFISAFLLYMNADEQNIKIKSIKRMKTLGVPFVIWNLFEAVFLTIGQQEFPCKTIGSFILLLSFDPFDGPLWYVCALLIFSVLSPFIIRLKRNSPELNTYGAVFLAICCFAFSIAYHRELISHELYWLERIIRYLPYYIAGILVAWYGKRFIVKEYSKLIQKICIRVSISIVILVIIFGGGENNIICFIALRILPVSFWLSVHCEKEYSLGFPMKISFFIYAMHDICLRTLGYIFARMHGETMLAGYQILLVRFGFLIVTYCIILLTAFLIYKFWPKLYFVLTGGRGR